ncbi:MAG: SDR family NAD(P)-dependent oxidoreductase [Rhodobacteraceae bacterium]|jgi:short-subunit dehydrogenase|nr:SDR family NAD(P)-dependent oxidoreductase [Paracoccaceae bacterium]
MRTWLVTGASGGLGAAIAAEALARGERVVLGARSVERCRDVAAAAGGAALCLRLDMADAGSIATATARIAEWAPRVDILVNNAGRGLHGAVEEVSDAEARALFEVNLFGLLTLTRALLPAMREARSGHVINIGSVAGMSGDAGTGLYSATKFALAGLSEAMRAELAPLGIGVTLVEPGPFRTEFNGASASRAARRIDDYAATAHRRIESLRAASGRQPGDPRKAARLICDLAGQTRAPLHLVLGAVAVARARAKLAQLAEEIDRWEDAGRATARDDAG